jgi:hypothetical protein
MLFGQENIIIAQRETDDCGGGFIEHRVRKEPTSLANAIQTVGFDVSTLQMAAEYPKKHNHGEIQKAIKESKESMYDLRDEHKKDQEKELSNLLSSIVWFKLNEYGKEVYDKHLEKLEVTPQRTLPKNDSGYTHFELWCLMNIFGPVLFGGNTQEPFVGRKIHNKEPKS